MPLDPQVKAYLDQQAALDAPPRYTLPVPVAREQTRQAALLWGRPAPVASIQDRIIAGPGGELPLRIYTPAGTAPFAALVYFHGGGWVVGSIETHETLCCALANKAGCVVVSVDYRLAPENKFPAALEDCYAATEWFRASAAAFQVDPNLIAVGGDSAGGNLAAAVCLQAREKALPLVYQLLIYPIAGYYNPGTPSYHENASGVGLSRPEMIWFIDAYLASPAQARNPLAFPLEAVNLIGLPPALIITAEYDPLRDEGEQYAHKLQQAGVEITLKRYNGLIHNFIRMGSLFEQAEQAQSFAAAKLRQAFEAAKAR
jgi:acetyl esterase